MHYQKYFSFLLLTAFFLISCEKEDSTVIDPVLTFPKIDTAYLSPEEFDTSVVNCIATAVVTSEELIRQVTAKITNPLAEEQTMVLHDDGNFPDPVPGDGSYAGLIIYNMSCRLVGFYSVKFLAENVSGLFSTEINIGFNVINSQNILPAISNLLIYPDSVRVNVLDTFVFRVNTLDPNGSCDILRVFYDGKDPNGGNLTRRGLFDDGSCCIVENNGFSGDSIAGDGIYTRILSGPPDILGYYVYYLTAVDRSGDTSNVLSDSIYVYP